MYAGRRPYQKNKNYGVTLLKQIIISIIIVLLVIFIKKMDIAIVNQGVEKVKAQLDQDYKIADVMHGGKEVAAKLKNVPVSIADAFQKSESKLAFIPPADVAAAAVAASADQTVDSKNAQDKMTFQSNKELQVYSVGGGIVSEIGVNAEYGRFIKIVHGDDIVSVYGGCTQVYVKALEKVKKGQIIASIDPEGNGRLTFEMWAKDKPVNPADYIDF